MVSQDLDTFVTEIYPGIGSNPPLPAEYFLDQMILAPHNNDVDQMNDKLLSMMSGEEQVFHSADLVV
ncbi:hypothetical protein BJ322DRAFT_998906, partial [Thelephora terrestris]